jgi:hypothetical protein
MRSPAAALLALAVTPAAAVAQATPAPIARIAWLAGCWERRIGSRVVEEQWMTPRAGVMLGMGRTVRGDTLVEFEQVQLLQRGDRLVYAAAPSGQTPAEFESTLVTDSAAVFSNPAHDFPQRISYRRAGRDSLIAAIEGVEAGRARGVEFRYRRVRCP